MALIHRVRNRKKQTNLSQNVKENRYARQDLVLKNKSHTMLNNAKVAIIGLGGLASGIVPSLTGAGIGTLTLVDHDIVEVSNLHRQFIHQENMVGKRKVDSCEDYVRKLNSFVNVIKIPKRIVSLQDALQVLQGHSVCIDATDDVDVRFVLNEACIILKIPFISGCALGWFFFIIFF